MENEMVWDFLDDNGWNIPKLQAVLPPTLVNEISAIYANRNSTRKDDFYWNYNKSGDFSVKKAYEVAFNEFG